MQIIFLSLGILCLVMVFYGAKWLLRSKTIFNFSISSGIKQFSIKKAGAYSVCIKRTYFGESLKYKFLISKCSDHNIIETKENSIKLRFIKNGKMFVEHSFFIVSETGNYNIEAKIVEPNQEQNNLIIIKETVSMSKKILAILFLVFGVNGSFWGIMLALNPNIFTQ